jgi:pilus assembly protein CpaD
MTNPANLLRIASVATLLLAGSCAAPTNDGQGLTNDPAANHPITVAPQYTAIKLPFSAPQAGLLPDDAAKLDVFVADYLSRGNGSISISAASGPDASAALAYFSERLAGMGVPRSRILVGTHSGDSQVEIGYIAYFAHTDSCGNWSKNLGDTADNRSSPDLGCAVQQNIAAQVADPRDLIEPRPTEASDATRRGTVISHYEKGEVTQADKHTDDKAVEQSAGASDVGH